MQRMPWHRRAIAEARILFLAFSMKLSPARRVVFGAALLFALVGLFNLLRGVGIIEILRLPFVGGVGVPGPLFQRGTWSLFFAFALMNLLVLLEVADRLSLKNDLEIARDIQQAMLPSGLYTAAGVETVGLSRPANTVGGDFYDILPLDDGRLVITLGDVAGKGSPAALLMALLLAMLRTLVDEKLEPADLITRLNVQVCRHAPGSRFITLFYAVFDPRTGSLTYVSAGHMPPLLLRGDGGCERLSDGGISLGMFEQSTYTTGHVVIQPEDLFAVYSDGITEAESQSGVPFDEIGLETALKASQHDRNLSDDRRRRRPCGGTAHGLAQIRRRPHHSPAPTLLHTGRRRCLREDLQERDPVGLRAERTSRQPSALSPEPYTATKIRIPAKTPW